MIEAVAAMSSVLSELQALAGSAVAPAADGARPEAVGAGEAATPSFASVLQTALDQLDGNIAQAQNQAHAFAAGDKDIPLSDVMVSLEQANLSLQLAAGVRDKVVAAYTNIMNMPV
ncbi:MAG: flagellar hook-basal body complex protein FliE [Alphaproteobacteria bacterium]|nr:flagellar hook-basal body complex protein FliE [Alphaproteobacteria bacterium]MBV9553799.1 flagellar hook-basal body complex protein FliE [Alphaproteobacteria bacterium]